MQQFKAFLERIEVFQNQRCSTTHLMPNFWYFESTVSTLLFSQCMPRVVAKHCEYGTIVVEQSFSGRGQVLYYLFYEHGLNSLTVRRIDNSMCMFVTLSFVLLNFGAITYKSKGRQEKNTV